MPPTMPHPDNLRACMNTLRALRADMREQNVNSTENATETYIRSILALNHTIAVLEDTIPIAEGLHGTPRESTTLPPNLKSHPEDD